MTNVDENPISYASPNTVPPVSASGSAMAPRGNNRRPCVELLDPAMVQVLRRKTPTERVAMIFAANRTMRLRLEGHLRSRHPDWDDQAVMQEIARRMSRGAS
jgi:hypothetical protein